ncbi:MAG TPA: Ig-like domain-containing protein, partial [Gemmatimonadales bacterium]
MKTISIGSLGVIAVAALAACSKDNPVGPPVVTNVAVTPGADTLIALGRTRQFSAVPKDANGNPVGGVTLVWHSSNPSVATVDSATGIVTAIGNGLSVIRADAGGVIGQATLAVVQVVAVVQVTPGSKSFTAVGDTQRFVAVAKDSGNATVQGVRFLWVSSNGNAATVDTLGLATGRGPGLAIISATGRGVPGYSSVTVSQAGLHLVVTSAPATAAAGQVFPVAVQVELRDSNEQLAPGARNAVTVVVAAGAAHAAGTTTVGAVGGVATFNALWLEGPGGSYQLQATASGVTAATSASITLGPGAPAAIMLNGQPVSGLVGDAITIPTASLYDRWGNLATTATDTVTLLVAQSHWGTQLRGPTKVVPTAGVATFGPVVADRPGAATLAASIFGAVTSPSNQFQQRLDSARSIAAAPSGTCAVYRKGAFCWGDNSSGQLGDGTLRP